MDRARSAITHRGLAMRFEAHREALAEGLRDRFVPLPADDATRAWIDDAIDRPNGAMALVARAALRTLLSDYDANAMVDTHDMRVIGTEQLRKLLDAADLGAGGRLLDVGAGDGRVTAELAPLFDAVETTELSRGMAKRLRERGYACHEVDLALQPFEAEPFEAISVLNVIDRCSHPISLLEALRGLLRPGGWLLIAVPLPLRPHVHVGSATIDPEEVLPVAAEDRWEPAANVLVNDLFRELGFELQALARVPYLCRGGKRRPVTQLDDALFLLTRASIAL